MYEWEQVGLCAVMSGLFLFTGKHMVWGTYSDVSMVITNILFASNAANLIAFTKIMVNATRCLFIFNVQYHYVKNRVDSS